MKTLHNSRRALLFALLAVAFLFVGNVSAQRVNQGKVTTFTSTFNTLTATKGANQIFSGGTNYIGYSVTQSMPFTFKYDDITYNAGSTLYIDANGSVGFTANYPYYNYNVVANASYPSRIFPLSGLFSSFGMWTEISGSAPNRVYTIEWYAGTYNFCNGNNSCNYTRFQTKLYESSNIIEFLYQDPGFRISDQYNDASYKLGVGFNGATSPSFVYVQIEKDVLYVPKENYRLTFGPNIQLSATPKLLEFGEQIGGSQTDLKVRVAHAGTEQLLNINTAFIVGSSDFSIVSPTTPPQGIGVGQFVEYTIRFSPTSNGPKTAVLTFVSNGVDSGTQTIGLSGQGLAAQIEVNPTIIFRNTLTPLGDMREADILITSSSPKVELFFVNYPNGFTINGLGAADYQFTKLPQNPLPPGMTDTLRVRFRPLTEGLRTATVSIPNNSANNPNASVTMRGIGTLPHIVVAPLYLDFDSVDVGTSVTKTIDVWSTGSDSLRINNQYFTSNDGDFSIEPIPVDKTSIASGTSQPIRITFTPLQKGTRQSSIRINSGIPMTFEQPRRDTSFVEVIIRGNGVAFGQLATGMAAVTGSMQIGSEWTHTETITNTGVEPVQITGINLSGADASTYEVDAAVTPFVLLPGSSADFTVSCTPTAEQDFAATVTVNGTSNGRDLSAMTNFTVTGTLTKTKVTPTDLFTAQSVLVGESSTATVTIENQGSFVQNYRVEMLKGEDVYSFEGPTELSVAPKQSANVTVRFAPKMKGFANGSMMVYGEEKALQLVTLSGTGIEPELEDPNGGTAGVSKTEANGYRLEQNYPNPAKGMTEIVFSTPEAANVTLYIADATGKMIKTIPVGHVAAGSHNVSVNTNDIASGSYLYIFESGAIRLVRQLVITK